MQDCNVRIVTVPGRVTPSIIWIEVSSGTAPTAAPSTTESVQPLLFDTASPPLVNLPVATAASTPPTAPSASNIAESPASLPTTTFNTALKIGISVSLSSIILLLAFVVFGIPCLRRRRRERAQRRAVEEVERGIEMKKIVGQGSVGESKENMVLESKVEIVVHDGENERNVLDDWDGWSAGVEDDLEERGRKGMSLPRREY